METTPRTETPRATLLVAWLVAVLSSTLPLIIAREIFHTEPGWLFQLRLGGLGIALFAALFSQRFCPLFKFVLVIALLFVLEYVSGWIAGSRFWMNIFGGTGFTANMASTQVLRLLISAGMITALMSLQGHPSRFFLVKGNLDAAAQPIPLLMSKPSRWSKLGWILAVCITGGTLVFLILGASPTTASFSRLLPLLPAVLIFAVMNSFSEEVNYRASLLSVLEEPLGKGQSLLLTSLYFGIGHFYGVPYGIAGVIMASLLGWFLGKSMLETRGLGWAWFIHFLQDAAIFSFLALGSITPGG